jgi:hypothetical protein
MGRRPNIAGDGETGDVGGCDRSDRRTGPKKSGLTPVVGFYTAWTHSGRSHLTLASRGQSVGCQLNNAKDERSANVDCFD